MFGLRGNPTAENIFAVLKVLQEEDIHSDRNRSERLSGGGGGAQEPECTHQYMRIPSTARTRIKDAQ